MTGKEDKILFQIQCCLYTNSFTRSKNMVVAWEVGVLDITVTAFGDHLIKKEHF